MQKLILGIAAVAFFGCSSPPSGPQGYYERGIYIPTHVIECVDFCRERDKVSTLTHPGAREDLCECKCRDGSIKQIKKDGYAG